VCEQGAPSLPFGKRARKVPREGDRARHPKGTAGDALKPEQAELFKGGF